MKPNELVWLDTRQNQKVTVQCLVCKENSCRNVSFVGFHTSRAVNLSHVSQLELPGRPGGLVNV